MPWTSRDKHSFASLPWDAPKRAAQSSGVKPPVPLLLPVLHHQCSASLRLPMGQVILTQGRGKSCDDRWMLIARRWAPQGRGSQKTTPQNNPQALSAAGSLHKQPLGSSSRTTSCCEDKIHPVPGRRHLISTLASTQHGLGAHSKYFM